MVSSHLEGFIKLFKFEKYFFHDLAISIYPVAVQLKFLLSLCFSTFFQGTFGRTIENWINWWKEDKNLEHMRFVYLRGGLCHCNKIPNMELPLSFLERRCLEKQCKEGRIFHFQPNALSRPCSQVRSPQPYRALNLHCSPNSFKCLELSLTLQDRQFVSGHFKGNLVIFF